MKHNILIDIVEKAINNVFSETLSLVRIDQMCCTTSAVSSVRSNLRVIIKSGNRD